MQMSTTFSSDELPSKIQTLSIDASKFTDWKLTTVISWTTGVGLGDQDAPFIRRRNFPRTESVCALDCGSVLTEIGYKG